MSRFRRAFRLLSFRRDPAREAREEIELYLELRAEEFEREGMDPEAARRAAREAFGDACAVEAVVVRLSRRRERKRGGREVAMRLERDVAYAVRTFRRNPGFVAIAVATLALGIGADTAIFSVVDATVLRPLPFPESDRLVFVNGYVVVDGEVDVRGASIPEFDDWASASTTIEPMALLSSLSLNVTGIGDAARVQAEAVSWTYFETLDVEPALGRTFSAEEDATWDTHAVVVLGHGIWQQRFGGDPGALGRSLTLNGRDFTVVGVMPPDFAGVGFDADAWIPGRMLTLVTPSGALEARQARFLSVVGRLAPGVSMAEAQAELDGIAAGLRDRHPRTHEGRGAQVQSMRDGFLGTTGPLLWILFGAGGVVLLIACANVANLLLVRSHARTSELTVRRALGAPDGRLMRQQLTESLVLATLGGIAGLALAWAGLRILTPLIPDGVLPTFAELTIRPTVFLFTLIALGAAGILSGLVPAMLSRREDIAGVLRRGDRTVGGQGRTLGAQRFFVVSQVALALVLLVGAGLLTRSFRAQTQIDPGFDVEQLVGFRTQLPADRYETRTQIVAFAEEVGAQVSALPGVESVTYGRDLPLRGLSSANLVQREESPDEDVRVHIHRVGPDHFQHLGVEILRGRGITSEDAIDGPNVAVISRAMAERVWPGEDPVGRRFLFGPRNVEVVGIAADVRYRNLIGDLMETADSPDVFFAFWQNSTRTIEFAVRTGRSAADLTAEIQSRIAAVDADVPVYRIEDLTTPLAAQTALPRFAAFLMTAFSGIALALACIGLFGVLSYAVGRRSREIALRRALGATGARVGGAVVRDGLRLVSVGLVVGLVGAALSTRVLRSFLYEVGEVDPVTFAGVTALLLAVAVVAAVVPARSATLRSPRDVLAGD